MTAIQETPVMAAEAVRLTTTLNLLKKAGACHGRYAHLVKALGGVSFDHEAPINLLTILEHNGIEDCLWALCTTEQNCDTVARLMAADFAEAVLPIFERARSNDDRPRKAIAAARAFARGEIGASALAAARDAAWAAAWAARDAAEDAAGDAAWEAAWTAARAAAEDAAGDAAWTAARDAARAAAEDAVAKVIRRYLLP